MADEGAPAGKGAAESPELFLHLRLTGERFDAKGMPAESAAELRPVVEALFQFAREGWLEDHPWRERVPAGFEEAFDVRLVSIGDGSARPHLVLMKPAGWRDDDLDEIYPAMQRAPEKLVRALTTVRDDLAVPPSMAAEDVARLAKIGKSLYDLEAIEVGIVPPGAPLDAEPSEVVAVTADVRETLRQIAVALSADPEPEPVWVEGIITELDGTDKTFHLRTVGRRGLTRCEIADGETTLATFVKSVMAEDGVTAPDVRVQGWAAPDVEGRFKVLHEVTDVEIVRSLEEKTLSRRIDEVEALTDGWWGPNSRAVEIDTLEAARELVPALGRLSGDRAIVIAQPDGSVVVEREVRGLFLTASIEHQGTEMFLCLDDPEADQADEMTAPFDPEVFVRFLETGVLR
ncbi:hypothetical protein [Cellulomonas gelida]|uniref:Uncharacterized protein n=1 Tax=Cellulomonas gelida TaxID=1712 RepID=A0A4Y3KJ14_9CELL|nr:hypothetical protein [Cellulomonas gelida]GEA84399.1 hypothetical protein CGE01nite_16500 [Cellulomonas gelida]GGL26378.1 hypothetical protein GCM10009774_16030 [Cellulomonas gelida]